MVQYSHTARLALGKHLLLQVVQKNMRIVDSFQERSIIYSSSIYLPGIGIIVNLHVKCILQELARRY